MVERRGRLCVHCKKTFSFTLVDKCEGDLVFATSRSLASYV